MKPKPQDVKHHICPRCRKQATVLVDIKDDANFYPDNMGNIQYRCTNCRTIFSVDSTGKVILIKLSL